MNRLWPAGAATGIGSLPGTDPEEAARLLFGELPHLPHLPELPARGVGAEMIGRTAALLVDLPAEVAPTGWRLTSRPGHDLGRARDFLARDLDALERHGAGYAGPLKLQVAGPWTLAAGIELPSGHRTITDRGACRDLADSLAEGVRQHVAQVLARVPGASVVVQLDEPTLPAALAGALPTASGWGTVRTIDPAEAEPALRVALEAAPAGGRAVHCCAPQVPIGLLRAAGADAVAVDARLLSPEHFDAVATAVDSGMALWLGVAATDTSAPSPSVTAARDAVLTLWRALGFAAADVAGCVVPTPACGMAQLTWPAARQVLRLVREVGTSLLEAD